jgi:ketosteroid isomerase-like protein
VTTIHVNHAEPSAAQDIIHDWMNSIAGTLINYDVTGHMALISKDVRVLGVPDLGTIDYKDWAAQVAHEFDQKLIQTIEYRGDHLRAESPINIMFVTRETLTASDGTVVNNNLEVVLRKEDDGAWRVVQERFLDDGEARHFGLA